jgi:hypothetical protein
VPPGTYARGLRNAYSLLYDAARGRLLVGDVGGNSLETSYESILAPQGGERYGWPHCEGPCANQPSQSPCACDAAEAPAEPAYAYAHDGANAAVVLGAIVDAKLWPEGGRGRLYFADYARALLYSIAVADDGTLGATDSLTALGPTQGQVTALAGRVVAGGDDAELWYATLDGALRRLIRKDAVEGVKMTQPNATPAHQGPAPLTATLTATYTRTATSRAPARAEWVIQRVAGAAAAKTMVTAGLLDPAEGDHASGTVMLPQAVLLSAGRYEAVARLFDADGLLLSTSSPLALAVGDDVHLVYAGPSSGDEFHAGSALAMSASAWMGEGPPPAVPTLAAGVELQWRLRLFHDNHEHPLAVWSNQAAVTYAVPATGHSWEGQTALHLDVEATATATGRSVSLTRTFYPRRHALTVRRPHSETHGELAEGRRSHLFQLDGVARAVPIAAEMLVFFKHSLAAPAIVCARHGPLDNSGLRRGTAHPFLRWEGWGTASAVFPFVMPDAPLALTPMYGAPLPQAEAERWGCAEPLEDPRKENDLDGGLPAMFPRTGLVVAFDARHGIVQGTQGTVLAWRASAPSSASRILSIVPGASIEARPVLRTTAASGAPYIAFDGIDDALVGAASDLPAGSADRSLVALVRYHSAGWGGVTYGTAGCLAAFGLGVAASSGNFMLETYCTDDTKQSGVSALDAGWTLQVSKVCGGQGVLSLNATYAKQQGPPLAWATKVAGADAKIVLGAEHNLGEHVSLDVGLAAVYDRCLTTEDVANLAHALQLLGFEIAGDKGDGSGSGNNDDRGTPTDGGGGGHSGGAGGGGGGGGGSQQQSGSITINSAAVAGVPGLCCLCLMLASLLLTMG